MFVKENAKELDLKLEAYTSGFKVIEVNVSDQTESLPALVNPIKINM
ncbi:hypothetical protein FIU87_10115 [Bacillus sp. THAF10]|nr:hypothetical protein FIU87_10115 [Bacillus sp. THAF10]